MNTKQKIQTKTPEQKPEQKPTLNAYMNATMKERYRTMPEIGEAAKANARLRRSRYREREESARGCCR